jgi:drug/metabolite transporter (DMT)-like permease
MLLIILIITGRPIIHGLAESVPITLYTGLIVTGLGYLFYFLAIRFSNATTGSVTFLLKPALAPIIAVVALHENIEWNMFIGIALILTASIVNIMDRGKG